MQQPAGHEVDAGDLARLLSPALLVYLDHVRGNIARVLARLGGDPGRWRPHVKTAKLPAVYRLLLDAGIRAFKCATTREAADLLATAEQAGAGAIDLLHAYPAVGPALGRLGALARGHPAARLSVLVECPETLDQVPAELSIFLDLNPGMDRTGLALGAGEAARAVARRAGGRFRGLHLYEGHVTRGAPAERRALVFPIYDRLVERVADLAAAGTPVGEVVTSGTPTFLDALAHPSLAAFLPGRHRVSPGIVVFHDAGTRERIPDLDLEPAALVLSRVVSHPAPGIVTCDAGSKSLAAEAGDPAAAVLGWPGLTALRPSEEHLPLRVEQGAAPRRGEALLLFPRHICPTVNLAAEAALIAGGRVVDLVPVSGRAHELRAGP